MLYKLLKFLIFFQNVNCLCCSAIDGVACCSGSKWDRFKDVADKVFHHGITWERIAVLFYVAGKLAVRVG